MVIPSSLEERAVTAFYEAGCLGVEVSPEQRRHGGPRLALRSYFPSRARRRSLERRLAAALGGVGLRGLGPGQLTRIPDGRWAEAWQRTLKPMRIGRRFLVVPEGRTAPAGWGRLVIRVRFGQAFGTGEHPTTRMCLRLLESHLVPGDRVVDVGTGTGILAVAAHLLGAGRVLAVDIDAVALGVARDTLSENGLVGRIGLRRSDGAALEIRGGVDLLVINIGASSILRMLPRLSSRLAPGGRVIVAGHLLKEDEGLRVQGRTIGLHPVAGLRSRPWASLVMARPRT